jgi:flagellar motor switch protein FliG
MMQEPARNFTGVEKAAVLMMLVGDDEAAAILQNLDPEEVRMLGKAMFAVADVAEPQVTDVLDDFVAKAKDKNTIGFDPRPQIETMMTKALGADKAENVLSRITPREDVCQIPLLDWLEPGEIASLVKDEHPQIAAVLLVNLDPVIAAQVIEHLPDAVQPDVLHRIATLGPISPEALDMLRDVLSSRAGSAQQAAAMPLGGAKEAAAIMNNARKSTEQRVMPKVAKISKETAKAIEEEMFVFDHLFALDDKSMGTLLRGVESDVLVLALKGVDEAARGRFLGCMSSRAADGIRDEMEARGPVKLAEVMEAQKTILGIARQLAKDGTIRLAGSGDDDYV